MTLQEAINIGKRFKRPRHENWTEPFTGGRRTEHYYVSCEDILADDWQIAPEPIVFESRIQGMAYDVIGAIESPELKKIIGKRARVTVEILD